MRRMDVRTAVGALVVAIPLALLTIPSCPASAQTYKVIYRFTGQGSSENPIAGVTIDAHGNLFGTTAWGGSDNDPGDVYELQRNGSGFTYSQLFNAGDGSKGAFPWDPPVMGPGGLFVTLYIYGGHDEGSIVRVQPSPTICRVIACLWKASDIYDFTRGSDGGNPQAAVVFDGQGNMYGAAVNGGLGYGVVYEMTRVNGQWVYHVIYSFTGGDDGAFPLAPLLIDAAGNLYGTAESGGLPGCTGDYGCGTIYKLSRSGDSWSETTLYKFTDGADGSEPSGGLIADSAGNLYGATFGSNGSPGGTVYELVRSGDAWTFKLIYDLPGTGGGPSANLVLDSAGNLYGATWGDGAAGLGNVFKLTPMGNGWSYTSVHDFTGSPDGANANGGLAIDSNGVIYGTTYEGGASNCLCGVVFEITP